MGVRPVIWFTGISASGKTTTAKAVRSRLSGSILLDGDDLRQGAHRDLDLSAHGRVEQVRRTAELAKLLAQQGHLVLVALISPKRFMREEARRIIGNGFLEVYVQCPLAECQRRDPKGLYRAAAAGQLAFGMSGLTADYEEPVNPAVAVPTANLAVEACADLVLAALDSYEQ